MDSWFPRLLGSLLVAAVFSACGPTATLRPGAERVAILYERPQGEFEALGVVWCRLGTNFRGTDVNETSCRAHLRNDAHALGAEFIVILQEEVGRRQCANCVSYRARAYRRR